SGRGQETGYGPIGASAARYGTGGDGCLDRPFQCAAEPRCRLDQPLGANIMQWEQEKARAMTRRTFFGKTGLGLGAIALGALAERDASAQTRKSVNPLAPKAPIHPAK